jgi:Uma2 family endonuclease
MASSLAAPPQSENIAELLERLGNVPGWRVRLHPPPGQATERDVLEIHARTKRLCELVDGVLVEKAMGLRESFLALYIGRMMGNFVGPRRIGIVAGEAGMMRLESGRVRMPDVSFISWEQLPGRRVPEEPIPDLYPDLAVEVLSESNTSQEMAIKRQEYFGAGTRLVWQIDPRTRTAEVFTSSNQSTNLDRTGVLDGAPVLPGFQLPLADLFGELDKDLGPSTNTEE